MHPLPGWTWEKNKEGIKIISNQSEIELHDFQQTYETPLQIIRKADLTHQLAGYFMAYQYS